MTPPSSFLRTRTRKRHKHDQPAHVSDDDVFEDGTAPGGGGVELSPPGKDLGDQDEPGTGFSNVPGAGPNPTR
ncbi:hypothetical protein [Uliginosibacterium sp. H1]|uniref:hypothetical protein n=1 Tax=Uliginosibacterium sp. H1 TaxID=3114757 RepID=UPI002E194352|nr:hypothetical protein [Uliginosibacterium sp. H1]